MGILTSTAAGFAQGNYVRIVIQQHRCIKGGLKTLDQSEALPARTTVMDARNTCIGIHRTAKADPNAHQLALMRTDTVEKLMNQRNTSSRDLLRITLGQWMTRSLHAGPLEIGDDRSQTV